MPDPFDHSHPLYTEVNERYLAQKPFSSSDFAKMSDAEHAAVLHHSAQLQRGAPESAMLDIQKHTQDGLLSYVTEHVGDLYWRANHMHGATWGQFNDVDAKVRKSLNALTHKYGFERDMREVWEKNNVSARKAEHLGKLYAQEHDKLPIYTYPSQLMNMATHHLGNFRFGAAVGTLEQLKPHVLHPQDSNFGSWSTASDEEWDAYHDDMAKVLGAWKGMHSRGATIDFLKSQGR